MSLIVLCCQEVLLLLQLNSSAQQSPGSTGAFTAGAGGRQGNAGMLFLGLTCRH